MRVTRFAIIIGRESIRIPYVNQKNKPVVNVRYMIKLISLVDFVFIALVT